ncbi:MAG: ABC transporter permease [Clostridium sulfidigenes]|uniref:ABC transporter permease n=1 Tax=Clostridium sulfidigenes TaxID=318464 RepID=A0A927ZJN4_9CLOT|nr:ABC transporter permease [Clostridium sulfidigenes]
MKSFWGIVPRYIIKNKKRVSSIAVGIVLSIALIMTLCIMAESCIIAGTQNVKNSIGSYYDINITTSDSKAIDELREDKVVNDLAVVLPLGISKMENTKYSIAINGYDDNINNFMNIKLMEGRKPNSDNEIALEQWILEHFHEEYKVGDKIKLRYKLNYMSKEEPKEVEREFTLVGIFEYKSSFKKNSQESIGWVTRKFAEKNFHEQKIIENDIAYEGFINLNSQYSINTGNLHLINDKKYSNIEFEVSYEKLKLQEEIKIINIGCYILFVIFAIVVSIIIYNVFEVSVIERKKEFGVLRAIGSSPNRIRALVMIEGIIIGMISIPIGIIIGNSITKLMMIFLGYEKLSSLLIIPKTGVIFSIIIGLFAVIIGTYFPSKKASKVSPMEAISESESINFKKNSFSVDNIKIHGKEVKFSSEMAIISIKRNKKKFITSTISLSMTILLLMSAYYVIKNSNPIESFKNSYGNADFKITTNNAKGIEETDIAEINNVDGVSINSKIKFGQAVLYADREMITKDGLKYLEGRSKRSASESEMFTKGIYSFNIKLFAYDKNTMESIKEKVIEGNIDDINSEPTIVISQNLNNYNYTNIKVGDKVQVDLEVFNDKGDIMGVKTEEFKVGALVDNDKFQASDGFISIAAILSDEDATKYLDMNGYQLIKLTIDNGIKYEEAHTNLEMALNKIGATNLESYKVKYKEVKKQYSELSVVLYSFIFIVALISMINLINIMKMNVIARSKEIGMLRAIGFGIDEVKQMIMVEGVLYGVVSSVLGSILGSLLTYFIYVIFKTFTWNFPIITIIVISLSTITVTTLSSVISSRQLFKSSIVDSIRSVE